MKQGCPNNSCEFYKKNDYVIKDGTYTRADDSKVIQRYKCRRCSKKFSNSTFNLKYGQKKRRINLMVKSLLASNVSMRRIAIILNIHRITVKRKLIYLAKEAREEHRHFLDQIGKGSITRFQFDDLITIEHTKLKPLTVTIAVDEESRKILGAKVNSIPAFGLIADKARKKYGLRKNDHRKGICDLFNEIKNVIAADAVIKSDEHNLYPEYICKYFPKAIHKRYKGGRGCVAGQGELKKLNFDPLFTINHTCAKLRANINRLIRKTWCTTKKPEMLQKHIDLFISYHNNVLVS